MKSTAIMRWLVPLPVLVVLLAHAIYLRAATPPATAPAVDPVVVDAKTETIIRGALKYLAAKQAPNGSWASPGGEHPVAITGYSLMAFLAAGQLPGEGEYGRAVKNGAEYLMSCAREDGYITSEEIRGGRRNSNMYDHGIASIALGELYGQTQDPRLRRTLSAAIKLIISCQNEQGGWRYTPRPEQADISVTVLQCVALRVAKNSGLDVPQATLDRAVEYVKSCSDPFTGGFSYMPGRRQPGFAHTAAAIYSLQVCGLYSDPMVAAGSQFLFAHMFDDREWYTYGSFYAAPAQYMIGGTVWQKWYTTVKTELLENVVTQPGDKTIAYWEGLDANAERIGPIYVTAVYTMILAMPYHYVPVYQR